MSRILNDETPKRSYLRYVRLLAVQLERLYAYVHRFLAWITGRLGKPMVPEIYHATPVDGGVAVKGRVLLARKLREPSVEDPPLVNLLQMIKRWLTPERPRSIVRLSLGRKVSRVRADEEGYFELIIPEEQCGSDELLVVLPNSKVSDPVIHPLDKVGESYRCVVISDVDDTVLVTHAGTLLRMIATTLFGNALTRQLFPGNPALYQALRKGPDKEKNDSNPLAYVTSSPFNLHGMLHLIFEQNGLPTGPFFMNDWGLDVDKWFSKSHRQHKIEAIEQALEWFPDEPVILIGDSGQHDTRIYVEVALAYPERIRQILIHDVSGPERLLELNEEAAPLEDTETNFAFFSDCQEAAEILAEQGWISAEQKDHVTEAFLAEKNKSRFSSVSHAEPDTHS